MLNSKPILLKIDNRIPEVVCGGDKFSEIRRIAIIRNGPLADLIVALPAVQAIRRSYTDSWIGLIVHPDMKPLAEMVQGVNQVMADPGNIPSLTSQLVDFGADLVVCMQAGYRIARAVRKAATRYRVGIGYKLYSALFHRRVEEHRRRGGRHEVEYVMSYAHRIGAADSEPVSYGIELRQAVIDSAARWLELQRVESPFVVLHPGTGDSCPTWPASYFIELATLLVAEGTSVVFTLGPGEERFGELLDMEDRRLARLPRFEGDLQALAALLSRSAAVVGGSTGPVHLAAALGVPVLSLHPPWASCGAVRRGPYCDKGYAMVAELPEATSWSRRKREKLVDRLMGGIPPVEVLRCIRSFLAGEDPAGSSPSNESAR